MKTLKDLLKFSVEEVDGHIGHVTDIYFDDQDKSIAFIVIDSGGLFTHHKVLISPKAVSSVDWEEKVIHLRMTKEDLINSPDASTKSTVEQQYEELYRDQFGPPVYWATGWDSVIYPVGLWKSLCETKKESMDEIKECHLHSALNILDYHVVELDGKKGDIVDYTIDEHNWQIKELIVSCGEWLTSNYVTIEMSKIAEFSWNLKEVKLNISVSELESQPIYFSMF